MFEDLKVRKRVRERTMKLKLEHGRGPDLLGPCGT
jgi:hypothetical protein